MSKTSKPRTKRTVAAAEAVCTAEETTGAIVVGEVEEPGEEGAAVEEVEAEEEEGVVVVAALEGHQHLPDCLARRYMSCIHQSSQGAMLKAWTFDTILAKTTPSGCRLPCLSKRLRI